MNIAKLEKRVWVLIYGGIIAGAFGLSVQRSNETVGWALAALGVVLILAGMVLIWVRSRIKND